MIQEMWGQPLALAAKARAAEQPWHPPNNFGNVRLSHYHRDNDSAPRFCICKLQLQRNLSRGIPRHPFLKREALGLRRFLHVFLQHFRIKYNWMSKCHGRKSKWRSLYDWMLALGSVLSTSFSKKIRSFEY